MSSQELFLNMENLVENPEVGLRAVLSRIGEAAIVGSYDLGLINPSNREPDVDANVLVEPDADLVDLASSVGQGLVKDARVPWHKYEVYDNRIPQRPAMPNSVYLGAKAYVPGGKVAADVWLFTDEALFDNANRNHAEVKAALTPETTKTIVGIKEAAQQDGLYVPGFAVYRAVLEHGVTSLDDYRDLDEETRAALNRYKTNDQAA